MKINFQVKLGPFDRSMAEKVRAWRNDFRVMRWCRQRDMLSDWDQEKWYERQAQDPTIQMYAILTSLEGRDELVGVCGLTSIDWLNRRAEFSLYLRPDYHGKGLGGEALKLLLAHGFDNLGLNQIWGESFAGNRAIKTFEALGFKKDGTRRAFYFKDGAFHDAHLYSILREEWDASRNPRAPDAPGADPDGRSGADSPAEGDDRPTETRRSPLGAPEVLQQAKEAEAPGAIGGGGMGAGEGVSP